MRIRHSILLAFGFVFILACDPKQPTAQAGEAGQAAPVDSFAYWNAILLQTPADLHARMARARAFTRQGAFTSALDDYNQLLGDHPGDRGFLLLRGDVLNRLNRHDEALADFDAATKGSEERSLYFNARAVKYIRQGAYRAAIAALDTALRMNPRMDEAWYNKGTAYYELGDFNNAEYHFQRSIRLNPKHSPAFAALGLLFQYSRADSVGAEWYFNKALEFDPRNAVALFGLGNLDMSAGKVETAIPRYQAAIQADSTYAEAWANLGLAYFRKGDYALAESHYSAAIRHNDQLGNAFAMRGLIRCELGRRFSGCEDLQMALEKGVPSAAKEIKRFCE